MIVVPMILSFTIRFLFFTTEAQRTQRIKRKGISEILIKQKASPPP